MVVHLDLAAAHTFQQVLLLGAQHFFGVHGHELKRRMGLGHKAGTADGHLYTLALAALGQRIIEVYHLLRRLCDALNVLHGLRGQAHHEVELDRGVARVECNGAGLFDLVPCDILVDDVAQALGAGFGGEGQAALAHLGGLFNEALGEVVHTQRRQRQTHMLLGCPLVQIVQQLFQLAVVRGGQAGKAQFFIAGVGAQLLRRPVQKARVTLAHGTVQKARLTETATTHTAAQHLNAGAVLNGTHHGHHEIRGRGKLVQVLDDRLGDARRDARLIGGDGLDPAILVILHIVERRDIDTGDLCNAQQQFLFGNAALLLGLFDLGADAGQLVFALTQLDHIKKVRNGFRVAGAGATRHDQRPAFIAILGIERDARQIQHSQNIGIGKLVLQGEAHCIKSGERILALHGVERQTKTLHLGLHIQPRHKSTLAPPVFVAVEQLIQDLFAEEGHTYLIGVRKAERKADIHFFFVLIYTAGFSAGITAGLLYPSQCFFQFWIKHRVLQ